MAEGITRQVLALQPRAVVMAEGNSITRRTLVRAGCEGRTDPATGIGINGSGGPTCMTRAIWREL